MMSAGMRRAAVPAVLAIGLAGCETTADVAGGVVSTAAAAGGAALSLGTAAAGAVAGLTAGVATTAAQSAAVGAAGLAAGAAVSATTTAVGLGAKGVSSAVDAATSSATPQSTSLPPISIDFQSAAQSCLSQLVDGDVGVETLLDSLIARPFDPAQIGASKEYKDKGVSLEVGPSLGLCFLNAQTMPLQALKIVTEKAFANQFGGGLSISLLEDVKLHCEGLSFATPAGRFEAGLGLASSGCGESAPSHLTIKKAAL